MIGFSGLSLGSGNIIDKDSNVVFDLTNSGSKFNFAFDGSDETVKFQSFMDSNDKELDMNGNTICLSNINSSSLKIIRNGTIKSISSSEGSLWVHTGTLILIDVIIDIDDTTSSKALSLYNADNSKIINCSFVNISRLDTASEGLFIRTSKNVLIKDSVFKNIRANKVVRGIRISDTQIDYSSVEIKGCTFKNIYSKVVPDADAIVVQDGVKSRYIINNCYFENISKRFIKIVHGSGIVSNCRGLNNMYTLNECVSLQLGDNNVIRDCVFESKGSGNFFNSAVWLNLSSTETMKNVVIDNIRVINEEEISTIAAIRGTSFESTVIKNCFFSGFERMIRSTINAKYVYITDNVCNRISQEGSRFLDGDFIKFTGNVIDSSPTGGLDYLVVKEGVVTNDYYLNNQHPYASVS